MRFTLPDGTVMFNGCTIQFTDRTIAVPDLTVDEVMALITNRGTR